MFKYDVEERVRCLKHVKMPWVFVIYLKLVLFLTDFEYIMDFSRKF